MTCGGWGTWRWLSAHACVPGVWVMGGSGKEDDMAGQPWSCGGRWSLLYLGGQHGDLEEEDTTLLETARRWAALTFHPGAQLVVSSSNPLLNRVSFPDPDRHGL